MMVRFLVVVTLAVCCLIPVSAAADWLNSTCKSDSDCSEQNSACYRDKCLCHHGYYYSVGQHTCVEECAESDLQSTFVAYPGITLMSTTYFSFLPTKDDCLNWCRNLSWCRAIYYSDSICAPMDNVIEDMRSDEFKYTSMITMDQRMCA